MWRRWRFTTIEESIKPTPNVVKKQAFGVRFDTFLRFETFPSKFLELAFITQ